MEIFKIDQLKNLIQSAHVNFLIGSGLSNPFLSTLGSIEILLTAAQDIEDMLTKKLVEASLYAEYFNSVMVPCIELPEPSEDTYSKYKVVSDGYSKFITLWNSIIAHRSSSLLDKTINIFSTNIDNIVERVAEQLKVEFNDGFRGHLTPMFHEDSFNNVVSKISSHYHNISRIPVFNYLKIHGSINWKNRNSTDPTIIYDGQLELLGSIRETLAQIPEGLLIPIKKENNEEKSIDELIAEAGTLQTGWDSSKKKIQEGILDQFIESYMKLVMIHPRKAKFRESVLDMHFYELMRIYSNTLESEESVLFVMGFSFADEHLAQLTVRAANANPTLQIIVFAYKESEYDVIIKNLSKGGSCHNNNIKIITPNAFYAGQNDSDKEMLRKKGFIRDLSVVDTKQEELAKKPSVDETKQNEDEKDENRPDYENNGGQQSTTPTYFSLTNINKFVFSVIERLINAYGRKASY